MSFLGEIKRRKVFQVAAVYAVVAWLLVQIADVVLPAFEAPAWVLQVVIFLLVVGFPLAVILSWAFDLTPEGIVRDEGSAATTAGSGHRLEFVLGGLLVIALVWIGFRELNPSASQATTTLPNSVAVLPFENLSPDPDDAYFAAGIHEQILNELAKIRDLNVIARTTMMRYAAAPRPIPDIADELHVETVMEGSVRYAGDQVRVTAQLIDGDSGTHLWTEDYDGDVADVFGIQSDIATQIAAALQAELLPAERESIERQPTDSPAAYSLYLSSLESIGVGSGYEGADEAISYLDQAIDLDPGFSLAYATRAYVRSAYTPEAEIREWERTIREDVDRALADDPSLGLAHAAMAGLHLRSWRGPETEAAFSRAVELIPNHPVILTTYSRFKSYTRQHGEAIRLAQRAVALDPGSPEVGQPGDAYLLARDPDSAAAAYADYLESNPASWTTHLRMGEAEMIRGNFETASAHLALWEQYQYESDLRLDTSGRPIRAAFAYSRMGREDDARRIAEQVFERLPNLQPTRRALAYLAIGDDQEALLRLREAAASRDSSGYPLIHMVKFNVWNDSILEPPEFAEVRARLGFQDP